MDHLRLQSVMIQQLFLRTEQKKVLLYFVGGVTYAEIGAVRFMNAQSGTNVKFFIATTQIITGNTAVTQMRTALNNNLDPLSIIQKWLLILVIKFKKMQKLTNAQKHEMLVAFKNERDSKYNEYCETKME